MEPIDTVCSAFEMVGKIQYIIKNEHKIVPERQVEKIREAVNDFLVSNGHEKI